jgi:hypothetical protein
MLDTRLPSMATTRRLARKLAGHRTPPQHPREALSSRVQSLWSQRLIWSLKPVASTNATPVPSLLHQRAISRGAAVWSGQMAGYTPAICCSTSLTFVLIRSHAMSKLMALFTSGASAPRFLRPAVAAPRGSAFLGDQHSCCVRHFYCLAV